MNYASIMRIIKLIPCEDFNLVVQRIQATLSVGSFLRHINAIWVKFGFKEKSRPKNIGS